MEISCISVSMSKLKYYIFNKPFDVLSQFTKEIPSHKTLQDYLDVPSDVYPIGRLDRDSEGLLLLTNDNRLKTRLLAPSSKSTKTYWVQVEGEIDQRAISELSKGVTIKVNKKTYLTLPAVVNKIEEPKIWQRTPPIRSRKEIPTSWIQIEITEGKNRQVRKMCASVGYPCLRLIRYAIKDVNLDKPSKR